LSVVVGPPEGILRHSGPRSAHNVGPVVVVRVDSDLNTHSLALRNHVEDELTITHLVRGPVVDLNIEPEHAELGASIVQRVDSVRQFRVVEQGERGMSRAWYRIQTSLTSGPGILDVRNSSLIDASVALADSADVEPVAVVLQT
ncbi:hypothetical protein PMAYCL1PPCAC_15014, partial [Pristionchus mayeri]